MQKLTTFLLTMITVLFSTALIGQGVTTSTLNGSVEDTNGEVLIGANVTAVHKPSGSMYGNSTNLEGIFRIQNMRVGGPYTVTVSYTGYQDYVKNNVYLSLGQAYNLNVQMSETATDLETVVVAAYADNVFDGNRTGQETVISEKLINDVPTISRSIGDYARLNPLANISEDDDGFEISLAGQNNRYNSIYIDGAVSNDVFGLAGSGTNGGQTGVNPISIDAIEQFQVSIAPFDVRQSGFAGGAINAVTRSGTNNFEGSAYYFLRNEDLAGKTPTDREGATREKLADFSAQTYGFRLGGPIVKNKVFFFVNAELQRDETPQPFDINTYNGDSDDAALQGLRSNISERFNYDIGSYDNNTSSLNSDKILAKLDFNLHRDHKLSVRHSYVKAENFEARSSTPNVINFITGSEQFLSKTNSTAIELNSVFGNTMSNNLTITGTFVRDDRDPSGTPFPTVQIEDGDEGDINLGAERFSTANLLNQDVFTIKNDFSIYKGKHNILFGANFELFDAANLFIRENYGRYNYFNVDSTTTGLDLFLSGEPASRFQTTYSQVDNVTGDESQAIADFNQSILGLYAQDEIQLTNNFKFTVGLRVDLPFWTTDQPVNDQFNTETIQAIESFGYDLRGAKTGQFIGTNIAFSPRVGFNYNLGGTNKTQIRGGVGIFTSRIPLVWPGGAYNNYGFNLGFGRQFNVPLVSDVQNQPIKADLNNITPSGQIDLFAEDFKLPQVLKLNLAVDQDLGNGFVGTLEGVFTKNINAVRYENLNLKPSVGTLTGPGGDNRPIYSFEDEDFEDPIDSRYSYIMVGSNTDIGYAYNLAVSVSKRFSNGLSGMLSYSYGDSYSLFDGTSSQNNSQWRGYRTATGRNNTRDAHRSLFAQGHRVFGQVSYDLEYGKIGRSKFSLNFNGQTGGFFSYTINANIEDFVDDGGFDDGELVWVPNSRNDINLVDVTDRDGNVLTSADQQWEILDKFISENDGLNDYRGDYVESNTGRLPFEFIMDFRYLQDIFQNIGGKENTLQLSVDIFNFTNLLNKDWGRRRFAGRNGNYNLLNLENEINRNNTTPEYTISSDLIDGDEPWTNNVDDSGFRSSRWQMQVGLRYIFK